MVMKMALNLLNFLKAFAIAFPQKLTFSQMHLVEVTTRSTTYYNPILREKYIHQKYLRVIELNMKGLVALRHVVYLYSHSIPINIHPS